MPDELKTLADIEEDAQNANLGTERGAFALQESLVRFGPGRSIVVDRKGRLIAGEKTKRTAERQERAYHGNRISQVRAR